MHFIADFFKTMCEEKKLKDKIFSYGIYGKQVGSLTDEEIKEACTKPWVEILSPEQVREFSSNFTLSPFPSFVSKNIPESYIVRMNLQAWRAHLFGPDFITTNKFYFQMVDYFLSNPGYVPCSLLRSKFNIDPKTMHYLCKKLFERGIIEEVKQGKETAVKLAEIKDRSVQKSEESSIFSEEKSVDTSKMIFYKNVPLVDQIKMHIECHENGFGTKELNEITGISLKNALKHLQKLCEAYPEHFRMVSSIEHGHTTFKVFSVENLNKRNQRKLETMQKTLETDHNEADVDPILTSKDRQEVLKIIAEKHGHFILSKQIFEEISRMTGYPYHIDRKNLISNAEAAGLKVFKLSDLPARRYVIALPRYDESILKQYVSAHEFAPKSEPDEDNKFYRSVKKYFMNISRCIMADNGYCDNSDINTGILYEHIDGINNLSGPAKIAKSKNDTNVYRTNGITDGPSNDFIQFDYQTVMSMKLETFFSVTKIKRPNFLAKCAFESFQRVTERFSINKSDIECLFVGSFEPKKLHPLIFNIIDEMKSMEVNELMSLVSHEYREVIREASNPFRYLGKLQKLKSRGLIDIEADDQNRIYIRVHRDGTGSASSQYRNISLTQKPLSYNSRAEFVRHFKKCSKEDFKSEAESILPRIFSRAEQKLMKKYISLFLKEEKIPIQSNPSIRKRHSFSLKESQFELYLKIKKALIFHLPIDFRILTGHENVDVEDVLEYMVSHDIASGYRSISSLSRIYLNNKFKAFLGSLIPKSSSILVDDHRYFEVVFPRIFSIVEEHGSIDFEQLVIKSKYFEPFEIRKILQVHSDSFLIREVDGFEFISVSSMQDPFD